MMAGSSTSGGERRGDREAMHRVADRMVRDGVPGRVAIEKARESMRRVDRQRRDRETSEGGR
jgi:hypothetical protein